MFASRTASAAAFSVALLMHASVPPAAGQNDCRQSAHDIRSGLTTKHPLLVGAEVTDDAVVEGEYPGQVEVQYPHRPLKYVESNAHQPTPP